MADKYGLVNVTLKALAAELGVKSPSLYKHIGGIDELNKALMLYGWRSLERQVARAAVGRAKDDAIAAMCYAYRSYATLHPGIFEAMQWYNMYQSDEHLQATEGVVAVAFQVLAAYDLIEEDKVHIVRMFRGFLQGFLTVENHGGFGNLLSIDGSFDVSIKILLRGIGELQGEK